MTDVLLTAALVVNLLLLVAVLVVLRKSRQKLARVQQSLTEFASTDAVQIESARELVVGKPRIFTLEILNVVELAREESRFADLAHKVAPNLLRKVVYERTRSILNDELASYGVVADVRIHVAS